MKIITIKNLSIQADGFHHQETPRSQGQSIIDLVNKVLQDNAVDCHNAQIFSSGIDSSDVEITDDNEDEEN